MPKLSDNRPFGHIVGPDFDADPYFHEEYEANKKQAISCSYCWLDHESLHLIDVEIAGKVHYACQYCRLNVAVTDALSDLRDMIQKHQDNKHVVGSEKHSAIESLRIAAEMLSDALDKFNEIDWLGEQIGQNTDD